MTDHDENKALPDLVLNIDTEDEEVASVSHEEDTLCFENSPNNQSENDSAGPSHSLNVLHNKQMSCEEQRSVKTDSRCTPRRMHLNNSRGNKVKHTGEVQANVRLCEHHTFLTDITEVRQMEQGLLKLLDDFHSGKLQAFGKNCTFEKMEQVREQQERLARLHFELNAQQEIYGPQSEEGRRVGRENLGRLIENLQQLSSSIENLQISSPGLQTDV